MCVSVCYLKPMLKLNNKTHTYTHTQRHTYKPQILRERCSSLCSPTLGAFGSSCLTTNQQNSLPTAVHTK